MSSLLRHWLLRRNFVFVAAPLLFIPPQPETEVRQLRSADAAYKNGRYAEALAGYLHWWKQDPDSRRNFAITFKVGYCYYQQRNFQQAIETMREASALDSALVDYCFYFVAKSHLGLRDTTSAIAAYEDLAARFPDSPLRGDVIYELAALYQLQGDLDKAQEHLTRLMILPNFSGSRADLLYRLGLIYETKGDSARALAQFRNIMERYPKDIMAFSSAHKILESSKTLDDLSVSDFTLIARVMRAHREYDRAIEFFTRAVAKLASLPKSAALRYEIADTYVKKGDYAKALESLSGLLTQAVDTEFRIKAMLLRTQVYGRQGEAGKAVQEYLTCANKFADRPVAATCLWRAARLAEDADQLKTAIEIYHRIAAGKADSPYWRDARWRKGFCLYKLGEYQRAAEIFETLRKENTADAFGKRAAYWSARCREKLGEKDAALEIYESLADSEDLDYHVMLSAFRQKRPYRLFAREPEEERQGDGNAGTDSLNYKPFERPLRVFDLLGKSYAQREMAALKLQAVRNQDDLQRRLHFFELVEAFGPAYRIAVVAYEALKDSVDAAGHVQLLRSVYPRYFREQVEAAARKYGVSPYLVWAITKRESAFNPERVSSAGAIGLIQVMPETAAEIAQDLGWEGFVTRRLFEPEINVEVGVRYLRDLLSRFDGRLAWALAAYNGGPQNVKRWRALRGSSEMDVFVENIDFRETRSYVKGVLLDYWVYTGLYDGGAASSNPPIALEP